jgi:calcium-dependent protein kinase
LPFQEETIVDTIESIETKKLDFESKDWDSVSVLARDLLERMLQKNAEQRISSKECLLHPWFYEMEKHEQQLIKSSVDIDHEEN